MNPFQELMDRHRSIRKYQDKEIPENVLKRILESGTKASTSGNMQAYSMIVTQDQKIRERMLEAHFNQTMLLEAPAFITFCADFHRMRMWLQGSDAPENFDNFMSFMIATIDAVLASQNVALSAESEGLGICYMGTTLASCHQIAEILECPDHVIPVVGFSLGYPAEQPEERKRLPLEGIIHKEKYQKSSIRKALDLYSEKEKTGLKRYLENEDLRQKIKALEIENLAQVYTKLKYTKESHLEYSQNVLNTIKEKGFFNH